MINYQQLANQTQTSTWQEAVSEHLGPSVPYQWSVSDHRAACLLLALPTSPKAVLDVNCGPGNYSLALASLCPRVYATSPNRHAVRFLHYRAEQEGIHNIHPFVGAPSSILRTRSQDLILLPPNTEMDQLKNLMPLLKPGGRLCMAVHNTSRPFTEHHIGWTKRGLHTYLTQQGLSDIHILASYPDIENVHYLIDTQDARGIGALLQSRLPIVERFQILSRVAHWTFVRFATSGYWAYGTFSSA